MNVNSENKETALTSQQNLMVVKALCDLASSGAAPDQIESARIALVEQCRIVNQSLHSEALFAQKTVIDGATSGIKKVDYTTDDYPREGCQIVIELKNGKYTWSVFRPSALISASEPSIEGYCPRPLGSIGIALDAFASGATVRTVLPKMGRAERDYSSSRSTITL